MFRELLDRVLHETPGAVGVTLMGFDGIAIDSSTVDDPGAVSLQASFVELGAVTAQLRGVALSLSTGEVREVSVHTGELVTLLRPLTEEYFLALSLRPGGNTGKGRYLMRVIGPKLVSELSA